LELEELEEEAEMRVRSDEDIESSQT